MKKNLPVLRPSRGDKPSIDAARTKLGGALGTEPPAYASGVVVTVDDAPAVVVFASASEVHVLLDSTHLRRVALPGELTLHRGEIDLELQKVAADAQIFGRLADGEAVRYADPTGQLLDGRIVEKCRYGALVEREDGVIVAVGFRKLWPGGGSSA